jgi:hypothetical protein
MRQCFHKVFCIFGMALFSLIFANSIQASDESQAMVTLGRGDLFEDGASMSGLLSANAKFLEAVALDPSDSDARLFLSITRIPALMDSDLTYDAGSPIENVREFLDNLGVEAIGRDIFHWSAKFTKDINGDVVLPADVPPLLEFQNFIKTGILQEVDSALEDLEYIPSSFTTILTTVETGEDIYIEVDYGDVLLYKTSLLTLKTFLQIILSYDIDINNADQIVAKMNDGLFNINDDLLDFYPRFFTLLADGASSVQSAKDSLIAAIDTYNQASEFTRNETDNRDNNLFVFDAETLNEELYFRTRLALIKTSLVNNEPVEIDGSPEINFSQFFAGPVNLQNHLPKISGEIGDSQMVDFSQFFTDPVNLRDYLPIFEYEPDTNDLLSPDKCTITDRTFSGILPNGLTGCVTLPGDVDHNGIVDLKDAILSLKVMTGTNDKAFSDADINFDSKIGLDEVLYLLQDSAELK